MKVAGGQVGQFRKGMNCMRASLRGREELTARVQQALALATMKEAEMIVETVVAALEATLLNNLHTDGFTLNSNRIKKPWANPKAFIAFD
jgi:hypothetical protein